MDFLLFLLAGVGITSIIVDSEFFAGWKMDFGKKITKRVELLGEDAENDLTVRRMRKLAYMLNCYQCSGFWVGLLLGILMNPLGWKWYLWPVEWLACGGAISYAAQVGMALYNYLNVEYGPKQ